MRQAGRHMKIYQELCKKHPTFRERSETVELAVEISLQPWEAFQPDGVILFSDILTPLTGEAKNQREKKEITPPPSSKVFLQSLVFLNPLTNPSITRW